MRKLSILLVLFLVSFYSFSNDYVILEDSIGLVKKDSKFHIKYLVSPGETIYGISTRYGVSISNLMEINPDLENGLKVGQIIYIPYIKEYIEGRAQAKSNNNKVIHKVNKGETLYSLSKKYGVTVGDLLKWNGLELKEGQEIVVGFNDDGTPNTTKVGDVESSDSMPNETQDEEQEEEDASEDGVVKNVHKEAEKDPSMIYHDKYDYDPDRKQVLIIPFDPHLYFSDCDDEIAARSDITRTMVRQYFRKRINALIDPPGYETIHLMGGVGKDSLADLNKVYSSVTYNYQSKLYSQAYLNSQEEAADDTPKKKKSGLKKWIQEKTGNLPSDEGDMEKEKGKYFGVKIKDDEFFAYFDYKYSIDYYVFINQFEVITDYENCLDRSAHNFRRYFVTHFSIFDKDGNQIAGNKFRVFYNSNTNDIMQIIGDSMPQVADRIMQEIPPADED